MDVHLEDVPVREPAGLRGPERLDELGAAVEEAEAGRAEQVLEDAGAQEVDVELLHVERVRADGLVGVEQHERAALTRDPRDALDVEARAVAVADRGDRDERRLLVDRGVERLERDLGALRRDVDHLCAARFLCVPDLADRRELEVGKHDLRALRPVERRRERRDAGRLGGRDRDLVRLGADQVGAGRARPLCLLDPVLPRRAVLVPVAQVGLVGAAHGIRERPLRARVDVDLLLEDRKAVPAAGRERTQVANSHPVPVTYRTPASEGRPSTWLTAAVPDAGVRYVTDTRQ